MFVLSWHSHRVMRTTNEYENETSGKDKDVNIQLYRMLHAFLIYEALTRDV